MDDRDIDFGTYDVFLYWLRLGPLETKGDPLRLLGDGVPGGLCLRCAARVEQLGTLD